MTVDYRTRCVLQMFDQQGRPAFQVLVYGCRAEDLMIVPNEVVSGLYAKYAPDYTASLFHIRNVI